MRLKCIGLQFFLIILSCLGKVGITIDAIWAEPKTNLTKDNEAAERLMQMEVRFL